MTQILKKAILFSLISITFFSCSKESNSSSTTTGGGETTTTNTWVKLTAMTSSGAVKANYIVMMFDQPVTTTSALPPIKKQVTTDANGLAYFDLNTMITSSVATKYYFAAFTQSGANYVLKSISNYDADLSKGTMVTGVILVK